MLLVAMIEIRFHGRGGQGAVTAAQLLAVAAFHDGKYSQAFPSFGPERRGAPVQAFCRIDNKPITLRSQIYNPDYVIVLDAGLLNHVKVGDGLGDGGVVIVNGKGRDRDNIRHVDVQALALSILGKPIVNTAILGAFSKISGMVTPDSLVEAINETMDAKIAEKNVQLVREAYAIVK